MKEKDKTSEEQPSEVEAEQPIRKRIQSNESKNDLRSQKKNETHFENMQKCLMKM